MKAKSLSVFRTKLHGTDENTVLVTLGQVIEGDEEHLRALARNRLVELLENSGATESKPPADKPNPPAKKTAGKPKVASVAEKAKTKAAAKDEPAEKTDDESPPEKPAGETETKPPAVEGE